jgi:hypothetical protein
MYVLLHRADHRHRPDRRETGVERHHSLGEAGTATYASVPGQAPIPTGAGRGGIYDPANPEATEHRQEDIDRGGRPRQR